MLTIKSDDVVGRAKAFEAIVKGIDIPQALIPESFKVLVKELQALNLAVDTIGAKLTTVQAVEGKDEEEQEKTSKKTEEFKDVLQVKNLGDESLTEGFEIVDRESIDQPEGEL